RASDGFWTARVVVRPETTSAISTAMPKAKTPGAISVRAIAQPSLRVSHGAMRAISIAPLVKLSSRYFLLRDDARSVARRAVVCRVLIVVGEGVEAGDALQAADRAGRCVVGAVVGDGDPGEALAVHRRRVRAAVANRDRKCALQAGGPHQRCCVAPVRGAA